jgi:luciferase family oxidoreductase group 1
MKLSVVDQSPIPAGVSPSQALHNSIDLARYTESLGYHRYWIAEHHGTPSLASPAPEILITRVAAETSRIRVGSGGVLLPHYSSLKVAECFRMLHALHPGRIDLGIGRAPGSSRLEAYALQRDRNSDADDFPQQLVELLAFFEKRFPEQHPFSQILVSPDTPGAPDVWLLGSSMWSSSAAAELGLPYAFAHFIGPMPTRMAVEGYRERFKPSLRRREPEALVALGVICADTEAEAQRLAASQRLRRLLRLEEMPDRGAIPTPEDALASIATLKHQEVIEASEWPRVVVGDPEHVSTVLNQIARQLQVDEIMAVTVVHDHQARRRSYELLARAFDLQPEPTAEAETVSG